VIGTVLSAIESIQSSIEW